MAKNSEFAEPLCEAEVLKVAGSAWAMEVGGRSWVGGEARAVFTQSEVGAFGGNGDAILLLARLRTAHGWNAGKHFALANSFRNSFGWTLRRYHLARNFLRNEGLIVCVCEGGRGPSDPPSYRLGSFGG